MFHLPVGRLLALGIALIPLRASAPPAAESLRQVAALRTARSVHTATTLASGRILITGGMVTGGASIDDVELFDPARNRSETLRSLREKRSAHTATLLRDGRVLIAGGFNGDYLASVEIFDPATGRFRAAGRMAEGRSGHTATLMPDGRVLMVGGVGPGWTFLGSAELFDPATGRSTPVGSMSVTRESHTATVLPDGRIAVIGGHTGRRQNMVVHSGIEIFTPRTGQFEVAATLETPRHKHDAVGLPDGRVMIVGGADRTDRTYFQTTEIFDPRTRSVRAGPKMTDSRYKIAGTSVLLPNGQVLITSGARSAELFDPATGTFRRIAGRFPDPYHFATASLLPDGDVIIAGGYTGAIRNTAGVWRFRR
ncbi:MAG TPA: kelch repeat-containing protein [Gemmatimonadaceae bacterium]|nr:kelch repeat-containing protein [Gemmatimonadaceae bacterium]